MEMAAHTAFWHERFCLRGFAYCLPAFKIMKRCLLIVVGFCLFTVQVQAQDKIDKSKKALTESEGVNYNKQSTSQTSSSSASSSCDSAGLGESVGGAVAELLFKCTIGAVWYGLVGNYNNEDHLANDLTEYPFYEAEAGNYYNPKFGEGSVYVFRADVKDKFIYSSNDLLGNHLELKVRPFQYFYLKADYYQIYEFQKLAGTYVDGKFTLGENIGDLGGVNAAYDGLQLYLKEKGNPGLIDGYTPEQRFFISWATIWRTKMRDEAIKNQVKTDPHSPGMYRAYVPLQNVDAFYEAFGIKEGDGMYVAPDKRVKIW